MRLLLLLLIVVSLCPSRLCCQKVREGNSFNRLPIRNTLKLQNKQKQLWSQKRSFFSVNFQHSRNISGVLDANIIRRTSSYSLPLLYGLRLREKWSLELGPFVGLNRDVYQETSMLQSEAPRISRITPAYGMMVGFSRQIVDRLSLQLRVRKDFGSSLQAWEPIQLGWNLRF